MKWIKRHSKPVAIISIIIILIIVISVSFRFDFNNFGPSATMQKAFSFVSAPINMVGNYVTNSVKGIFSVNKVQQENEELKEKIITLNRELLEVKLSQTELIELRSLSESLNYLKSIPEYKYITAEVMSQDGTNWFSIFTINVGTSNSIKLDSIVICGDGLIGRVIEVGTRWAKVITILDEASSVSFRVSRDIDITGVISGNGKGGIEGYLINSESEVMQGDIIITSGIGIFPEGIIIGKISEVISDNDKLLKTMKIESNVDFKSLQRVTVITKEGEEL